jgi:hypothetical protein
MLGRASRKKRQMNGDAKDEMCLYWVKGGEGNSRRKDHGVSNTGPITPTPTPGLLSEQRGMRDDFRPLEKFLQGM